MKESLGKIDKNIVIQETFQSEDEMRSNSFIPYLLTFSNGVATFTGNLTSYATCNRPLNGVYTVRIKLSNIAWTLNSTLFDCRASGGTGLVYFNSATTISASSGTVYVDGVKTTTYSQTTSREIVISGITLVSTLMYIGKVNTNANKLTVSLDLFQVWNRTLTANEIKALSNNSFAKGYEYIKTVMTEKYNNWYGITWDITASDPSFTRIGNLKFHSSLPIQSKMKRCILNDNGNVVYYLHPTNSLLKENGAVANLDGTDGQFMVEIPYFYWKEEFSGNTCTWKFSEYPLAGYIYSPRHYESAFEATVQRSTNKLCSVINTTADYRGGNNNAAWDSFGYTLIGKPATVISRTTFRTYSGVRGAGWTLEIPLTYNCWRKLMFCEYATRNVQLAFNPTLTAQGYKQGGLGPGVTNAVGAEWSAYNSYYPFINCGVTTSLGNASGVIDVTVANFGGAGVSRTHQVNSYRGIENPWGHIWKWLDGYNIWAQTVGEGSKTLLYTKSGVTGLTDNTSSGYDIVGELPRSSDWVKTIFKGHLFPLTVGGTGTGSTTFWCDYFYTDAPTSFGWRAPLVGGNAHYGSNAGPVCVYTYFGASTASSDIGSRLCFLPNYNL